MYRKQPLPSRNYLKVVTDYFNIYLVSLGVKHCAGLVTPKEIMVFSHEKFIGKLKRHVTVQGGQCGEDVSTGSSESLMCQTVRAGYGSMMKVAREKTR